MYYKYLMRLILKFNFVMKIKNCNECIKRDKYQTINKIKKLRRIK